ncbi:hypothetical protein KFE25_013691 [Diacronema lutheri]|uniref:Mitochondrial import inner membrane translocase subunit TIM22 n=1 Tax=Diacronema lutheri TaxID=2081491 RepID=A0A8J6CIB0_DIALT|nr:hypothetical protein KFE25_013691 [Diacronema lutheri]
MAGAQGNTHIPCIHRTADGAFRGAYIGVVWGGYFAREHLREAAHSAGLPSGYPLSTAALKVGRFVGAHVLGFSLFLGGYNAFQCSLERTIGQDSGLTPIVAGATLGALASCILPTRPTVPSIAAGAAGTACACYVVSRSFLPPPSRSGSCARASTPACADVLGAAQPCGACARWSDLSCASAPSQR